MLSKIRLSKAMVSSPLIHIHICIIVCGATTGSHFTQNLLLNAQQCRYVRLCNKLYILKLVLTKSYKEILVFFLNTLTAAFSYVCRLSVWVSKGSFRSQVTLLCVSNLPLLYTTHRGTKWFLWNNFCRSILKVASTTASRVTLLIYDSLFLKQEPLELNYCESLWITWAICRLVVTWHHCVRTDICFDFFTEVMSIQSKMANESTFKFFRHFQYNKIW